MLKLFDVSVSSAWKCLKGTKCEFYIKIYTDSELQEIEMKIYEELKLLKKANGIMLNMIKKKYRVSSKEIRKIANVTKYTYSRAEKDNVYIKLKTEKVNLENELKGELYSEEDRKKYSQKLDGKRRYRMTKKYIENICKEEKNSILDVGKMLGISKLKLSNLMENKQLTAKVKDMNQKKKVDRIAMDIKYLKENGERYYKQEEIDFFQVFYNVTIQDMLYYLSRGKTIYDTYIEALKNNPKGIWIGERARISNEYIEEQYDNLE